MQAFYKGDVRNVLFGRVPEELKDAAIDTTRFRCGFESGSVCGSLKGEGEMILVGGTAYVRCTDSDSKDNYLKSIHGTMLHTTGAILVMKDSKPSHILTSKDLVVPSTLSDVISMAWKEAQHTAAGTKSVPVVLSGIATFARLRATYITKAPLFGDNLFAPENKPAYFSAGEIVRENVLGAFVAVAHDFSLGCATQQLQEDLARVLYLNPNDPAASHSLSTHTHVLLLNQSSPATDDLQVHPSMITDDAVFHLYSDSVVSDLKHLNVFPLTSLTSL